MIAVLMLPAGADISLGAETSARLARFGITHAALLADDDQVAVVLEGWAFDPDSSAADAAGVVAGARQTSRVLRCLAEVAVPPDAGSRAPGHRLPRRRREEP
ncbi:MAG: hypothetical protein ACRDHJ_04490 [Actinomycetota bacterium]